MNMKIYGTTLSNVIGIFFVVLCWEDFEYFAVYEIHYVKKFEFCNFILFKLLVL